MSTIFAQISAKGKAGVGVFRISGSKTLEIIAGLTGITNPTPRKMIHCGLSDPRTDSKIDDALLCFFKGPASFTGEDSAELYTHGSIIVSKLLTNAVLSIEGVRYAEGGEFTKRSFLNGKLDLTRAEAIADMIDAETEFQHSQAIRQLSGELESLYNSWRESLLKILALFEAYIDFPEEEISVKVLQDASEEIGKLKLLIAEHLDDNRRGERLRNGLELVIIGKPNSGKSSLMNLLTQREVSMVSNISGTTRDIIESHLDIGGYPVILKDTAGLVETSDDPLELEGVKRAKNAASNADIKLILLDIAGDNWWSDEWASFADDPGSIFVINKSDLFLERKINEVEAVTWLEQKISKKLAKQQVVVISAKAQIGLEQLLTAITAAAANCACPSKAPVITRARHRIALRKAQDVLNGFDINGDLILVAEDMRIVAHYLSLLTGKISVDEILGEIFSKFCIGK